MNEVKKSRIDKGLFTTAAVLLIVAGILILAKAVNWDIYFRAPGRQVDEPRSLVRIWLPDSGIKYQFYSNEKIPANLLLEAGIRFYPGDELQWNGKGIAVNERLPQMPSYLLQIKPQVEVTIEGEIQRNVFSNAPTLAGVLWESGIHFTRADYLSAPFSQQLITSMDLIFRKAIPVTLLSEGREMHIFSSAASVGQVLADAGISLQSLDYSIPAEEESLPEDGAIEVIRVQENVQVVEKLVEFEIEKQPDPEVDVNQEWIIEQGEEGLNIAMERIRFENAQEVSRSTELEWVTKEPRKQIVGYGTKPVPLAAVTGGNADPIGQVDGSVDYWAVKTMYATSYYPCGFRSGCSYITASGATLQKGVVALSSEWYSYLAGTQVYIPGYGYGIVADMGGGIPGTDWIDLGYGNDDYVQWSENVTVYFLNPAPAEIPWFLR